MRFLTIKELNKRQVRQVQTLVEYYFEIKYTKSSDNVRVDTLSQKLEF